MLIKCKGFTKSESVNTKKSVSHAY